MPLASSNPNSTEPLEPACKGKTQASDHPLVELGRCAHAVGLDHLRFYRWLRQTGRAGS
jgi:hypothetical protein